MNSHGRSKRHIYNNPGFTIKDPAKMPSLVLLSPVHSNNIGLSHGTHHVTATCTIECGPVPSKT